MDDRTVGRVIRILRRREGLRQEDLGDNVGVSQGVISLLECGRLDRVTVRTLRRILAGLDADVWLEVRWRNGVIDRLLDEGHARLAGIVASTLGGWHWEVVPEVSYSIYGERGSIDLLAWHPASRTLLVIEVKTELGSVEATLRKHDEKVRLAPRIVGERFGWRPAVVARLLVFPSDRTVRRNVARNAPILERAYPVRGDEVRRWLRKPAGTIAGLWFVSGPNAGEEH